MDLYDLKKRAVTVDLSVIGLTHKRIVGEELKAADLY
jgi:hypothetical protein